MHLGAVGVFPVGVSCAGNRPFQEQVEHRRVDRMHRSVAPRDETAGFGIANCFFLGQTISPSSTARLARHSNGSAKLRSEKHLNSLPFRDISLQRPLSMYARDLDLELPIIAHSLSSWVYLVQFRCSRLSLARVGFPATPIRFD